MNRIIVLLATLTLLATGAGHANTVATDAAHDYAYPEFPKPDPALVAGNAEQVTRGEYLAKLADCMACHTDPEDIDSPFAGGLRMDTPFGALYTPNITPDRETGLGNWTAEQFLTAVREGESPDGDYYYPVFPYNYFTLMSDDDVLAIWAYLKTIPAVNKPDIANDMEWPFNYRFLQFGWRLLYFDEAVFEPDANKSEQWNRGAFIVKGPGHCAMCHTQLNMLGAPESDYYLAGAFIQDYYAPDITARGLKDLSNKQVAAIFADDRKPQGGSLEGPMADVEHNSLRYLKANDILAIAEYLRSVESEQPPIEDIGGAPLDILAGKKLYLSNCKICHSITAIGAPVVGDKAAWENLLNQGRERLYEVAIKGSGPMPARGGCSQCSDARLKAAVDYMIEQSVQQP